jgi:type VI protein secretion system component VasF
MNGQSHTPQIQDFLINLTDAILAEENVDRVYRQYDLPSGEVKDLVTLIRGMHTILVGVRPSKRFAQHLKQDLMGAPRMRVITRIRHLPPRVQIAAGVALVAGFLLLARRRLLSDTRQAVREIEATV